MLDEVIVTPSISGWSFSVAILSRKDGTPRLCVDYRALNSIMKPDKWPPPRIEEIFDDISGGQWFNTLALFSGYWKIFSKE